MIESVTGGYRLESASLSGSDTGIDLPFDHPFSIADKSPVGGQAQMLIDDDVSRWTALGLAIWVADLVGVMEGATSLTNHGD